VSGPKRRRGGGRPRSDRPERPERGKRPDRPERPERGKRPDRPERPERGKRPDRAERPDRPDRSNRADRPDRADRAGRPDHPATHSGPNTAAHPTTPDTTVYGRNAVEEALRAGRRRVHRIWATQGAAREDWLAGARVPVEVTTADDIARRAGTEAHQGVCAEVDPYRYADAADLLARPDALIVALDEVQDPQNLGAICRTAECAGAAGVVICERRAAQVTAAVAKASAGAVEHLPVARVRNLTDFLLEARDAGAWSYGAAATEAAVPYTEPDYGGSVVLVMGSEGRGLRPRVVGACDQLIALPMHGRIASLNVSAAASALLYGILQRRVSA
jgi:23S rRNA (guanosine2251-2'-O)-methyltransferase